MSEGATSTGHLVAVCIGDGGIPKAPVDGADCGPLGLVGDGHRFHLHGGEARALCLLSTDEVASLASEGLASLVPGSFGENLLVEGLDFGELRPGDRLSISDPEGRGGRVVCELTDIRTPCKTLAAIDPRFPDLMVGRSGFVAKVVEPGRLEPGMEVRRA